MADGKLWGQPALLHSTDGIRRDLVLFRYTGKPFPGALQCARTQNLGQLIGGLIEIGEAKVLAYTLERVSHGMLPVRFLPSATAPALDSCRRSKTSAQIYGPYSHGAADEIPLHSLRPFLYNTPESS